jgi:hypothetical protein
MVMQGQTYVSQQTDTPEMQLLLETLRRYAWTKQTAHSPDRWSSSKRSTGQCAVTALIVHDWYGGDIVKVIVNGRWSHYYNVLPDGTTIDLTRDQFDTYAESEPLLVSATTLLKNADTLRRYGHLRGSLYLYMPIVKRELDIEKQPLLRRWLYRLTGGR